jgi:hypothetical protein
MNYFIERLGCLIQKVSPYSNETDVYSFHAFSDPIANNPAHAEVRTFLNGQHFKKEPPKKVKLWFRASLAAGIKIEIEPY